MGSLLAPVLTNIFMGFHKSNWLNEYNLKKPKFYLRYVDDILAAFDDEQNSWNFLNILNNRHPNIKFTVSLKIPSPTNSLIANDIRTVILEIKSDRCKIVKILIFCCLSGEHFQSKWKLLENVLGKENEISVF